MIETLFILSCIFLVIAFCALGYVSYYFRKKAEENDWHLLGIKCGRTHSPDQYTTYGEMIWYYRNDNRFVIVGIDDGWHDGSHVEISGRIPETLKDKSDKQIQNYLVKQFTPWVKERTIMVGENE